MNKKLFILLATLCIVYFAFNDIIAASTKPPQLNETRTFWTWNLRVMPPENVQTQATCRGIGENIYIFVSDSEWLTKVDQKDINIILEAFDHKTPTTSIDPEKGIYDIAAGVFGPPPDIDNDRKIYLLISQLSQFKGHHFDGFFRVLDQLDDKYSNRLDMLYVDSDDCSDEYHLGVLAHEFHHLIHWTYDRDEVSWISESLAEISMVISGYHTDMPKVSKYLGYSNVPLVTTRYSNYGACLLWGMYLFDRFGEHFVSEMTKEGTHHIEGFENALKKAGIQKDFREIFGDWMTANYLNDARVDNGQYAYKSFPLPRPSPYQQFSYMPVSTAGEIKGYCVKYFRIITQRVENDVQISFTADDYKDFLIRAIKINNTDMSKTTVEQLEPQASTTDFFIRNSMNTPPTPLPSIKRGLRGVLRGEENIGFDEIVLAITVMKETDKPLPYSFTVSFVPE